jgi:hypothetical protein
MTGNRGSKWSGTFQWWDEYPPGKVKKMVASDIPGYESSYVRWFNLLKEYGFEKIDNLWCTPDGMKQFPTAKEAYDYLKIGIANGDITNDR